MSRRRNVSDDSSEDDEGKHFAMIIFHDLVALCRYIQNRCSRMHGRPFGALVKLRICGCCVKVRAGVSVRVRIRVRDTVRNRNTIQYNILLLQSQTDRCESDIHNDI